jgi:Zn-dependent peptidase ImmA (M78 family)/transcriptional regulator with XRE-family HTH domain
MRSASATEPMAEPLNGELLRIAREFRGLNQKELAADLGVEPSTISRAENNLTQPLGFLVEKIAERLNFPVEFFRQPDRIYGLPISAHPIWRKRKAVMAKDINRVLADINLRLFHLRRLLRGLDFAPRLPIPRIDLDECGGDPENVAMSVRRAWLLPSGPVTNLTATMETAGILVFHIDLERSDIDGVTMSLPDLPPCVFLNQSMPADRMRFTLAHELGHIVMHRFHSETMEDEASAFASALLMPRHDLRRYFAGQRVDLNLLARLKPEWRVAMQSLLYRAEQLGYIAKPQAQYLWKQFSARKIKLREPPELDFPPELPTLVPRLFQLHMTDLSYSLEDMQQVLSTPANDLKGMYGLRGERPALRLVT